MRKWRKDVKDDKAKVGEEGGERRRCREIGNEE